MRIGYFDCFSGAAGDMILACMVSAGLEVEALRGELGKLKLLGWELEVVRENRGGIAAVRVVVRCEEQKQHRHLHHIVGIIDGAELPERVKDRARRVFTRLAEAEAKVHGTSVEKVHFHEVGAIDAIIDVVGAAIGIELLGIERVVCSPIPTGSGTVQCEHGVMPVPAPATAELLVGVPLASCDEPGELTTPTGAAILTTIADSYGPAPSMRIERIGYGTGTRPGKTRANILRLMVGEAADFADEQDEVVVLEVNLDDATGEEIGFAMERLMAAGALDVFTTPVFMKKGRPGVVVAVIAPLDREGACEEILLRETSTFGVRRNTWSRRKLARRIETVQTRWGPIRVKVGLRGEEVVKVAAEYEDCAAAARAHGVDLRRVMSEAEWAWRGR